MRNAAPIRLSSPMPRATVATSAPTASQTLAISLTNEIFVARKALAASLTISAEATSHCTTGAPSGVQRAATASAAEPGWPASSEPSTTRSGWSTSCTAEPSRRNSGFDT
ncbi:MAG: hypothetical protein R2761_05345 [Acidimicrobiales bacterium]